MTLSGNGYRFPEVGTIFDCESLPIEYDSVRNTYYVYLIYSKLDSAWKLNPNNKGLKCVFGKEFHIFLRNKKIRKIKILHIAKNKKSVICEPLELV